MLNSGNILYNIAALLVYAIMIFIMLAVFGYMFGWIERKIIAKAQYRHGPTYVGKYGILQNFADLVKLFAKGSLDLDNADSLLYGTALPILISLTIFVVLILPIFPSIQATNLSFGLLLVLVVVAFMPIMIFLSGFASGNKFADISAQRSILMLLSYEIPLMLVIVAIGLVSKGYNLQSIIAMQSNSYYILLMPIGFFVFFIAMLAEIERPPFDLMEADSELIAGWITDMSPAYYALVLFLDYSKVLMSSLLISILFLGGWLGPQPIPGVAWLIIKAIIIAVIAVIIRATTFRMRIDRILRMGWMILIPLSLINLIITYIVFVG
jgi:NADH-quinone oxidoreductase subunit H